MTTQDIDVNEFLSFLEYSELAKNHLTPFYFSNV